jgi:hypothetical protein
VVVVGAGVGAAVVLSSSTPTAHKKPTSILVDGTFDLDGARSDGNYTVSAGDSCEGTGGYDDLSQGATVKVTGPKGHVLATTGLTEGVYRGDIGACEFTFRLKVPPNLQTYGISISHRGTIQFTEKQMKNGPSLDIGGS